jgi:hypothetical protein
VFFFGLISVQSFICFSVPDMDLLSVEEGPHFVLIDGIDGVGGTRHFVYLASGYSFLLFPLLAGWFLFFEKNHCLPL